MNNGIISKRRIIQALTGGLLIVLLFYFKVHLVYILALGAVTGIIFGKVFCRWMCPMGFIMELMLGNDASSKQQLYNYHKLGCPIAWVSGFMNRFSLFKIKRAANLCVDCGICDKTCYIASLDQDYSLYKEGRKNPTLHYSCSKCLACVEKCPAKSLRYKI